MAAQYPLVAIVGRPNVGKSSLFNRLTGTRSAITDGRAGTTRDANYGNVDWGGKRFTIVDTAGLSRADGEIELQAQDQIKAIASTAAIIVVAVDAATMVTSEDQDAARLALKTGKPVVLALSKADTAGNMVADEFRRLGIADIIPVSAIHGRGTGDLLDALVAKLERVPVKDETAPLKLALVGRPNVGKSSILNALIGKQKSIVSNIPGTTRDVTSDFIKAHNREIELLDTAGLRRRGKIEPGVEKYSSLRTLTAIYEADVCVLVLDASDGVVATDLNIAGQVIEAGKGLILVMNKWDIVDKDDKTQAVMTHKLRQDFQFVHWAPLVYTSATTGLHLTKILDLVVEIEQRRKIVLPTGPLNRLVEALVAKQPPAGLKGKFPKVNYVTQTGTNPPAITVFCTYPDLIHFSYRRYMENNIRENYDLTGTPIHLDFRHKHGDNLRHKTK
jgi:GTP-binding protein